MCKFFSLVSDGNGKIMYFDWEIRKKILAKELNYEHDSHTSIADYFGYKAEKEDTLNKYEYNPLTKEFKIDQLNTVDDSLKVKEFCLNLDFKTIVPQLIIKPIVNPLSITVNKITIEDLKLLKQWDSVRDSVGYSVRDSVGALVRDSIGDSVRDSIGDSVGTSVRDSVGDSVGTSVWTSVWTSVRESVWTSVRDSVWTSIWAYASTFVDIKYNHAFTSINKLWERGIVPSYDGKIWRLHTGMKADIIMQGTISELEKEIK